MKLKQYFLKHPVIFMGVYTIIYFILFTFLEKTVVPRYIIHTTLDNYIPFCEYFIVPYLMWFIIVPGVLFYLVYNDRDSFWKMTKMMFTGNMLCLLIYALFPNGVMPKEYVTADNIFSYIVNIMYYTDTPTNVCPSIHVLDTLSAHIALTRSSKVAALPYVKLASLLYLILVCIATVTLKQHSIVDVVCAFILMFFLEKFAYQKNAQNKLMAVV